MPDLAPSVIGVSLKLYLGHAATIEWSTAVADIARRHEAIRSGRVSLFVLPSFPSLSGVIRVFDGTGVSVGAQDLFWEDRGPYTGEVSGSDLRELGCTHVELGHFERRRIFGEDNHTVTLKLRAAFRNRLRPVLCIGEPTFGSPQDAAEACIAQLAAVLGPAEGRGPIIVAYEPAWAIGVDRAATADHIGVVAARIRQWLATQPDLAGSAVIYGGSAGPGLLSELGNAVDGLFLGRFAHDTAALEQVLDEAIAR